MKVAVAYENGEIYGHFGHCPMFAVYEYGEYVHECEKKLVDTSALSGHQAMADKMRLVESTKIGLRTCEKIMQAMADKMRELEVDAVICGNMGGEGKALLLSYGIVPIVGYSGDADTASDLLVTGRLPVNPSESSGGGCSCSGSCGDGCSCGSSCGGEEGGCSCGCGSFDGEEAW